MQVSGSGTQGYKEAHIQEFNQLPLTLNSQYRGEINGMGRWFHQWCITDV